MKVEKKLKFNFIIMDRMLESKFIKFLKKYGYVKYFMFYGKGSASSAILDYLGIGETGSTIMVYPSNEKDSFELFDIVSNSDFIKNVIAFRVPIKGISSKKSLDYFLKEVVRDE